jgi:hypothetical protein
MLYNLLFSLILPVSFSLTITEDLNYEDTTSWGGKCQIGQNQSPINIDTKKLILCPKIHNDFKYLSLENSF